MSDEIMGEGLESLLVRMNDLEERVPELFSSNCFSPIWFVGQNPRGEGYRPTVGETRRDRSKYIRYYVDRYKGLNLANGPRVDHHGQPLAKAAQNFLAYTNAFCTGAGVPEDERSKWVMKTNAFGVHAHSDMILHGIENTFSLSAWLRKLAAECKPALVVGFGVDADEALRAMDPDLLSGSTYPKITGAMWYPMIISFRSVPAWRRNNVYGDYFHRLGNEWAIRSDRHVPPAC